MVNVNEVRMRSIRYRRWTRNTIIQMFYWTEIYSRTRDGVLIATRVNDRQHRSYRSAYKEHSVKSFNPISKLCTVHDNVSGRARR